MIFVSTFETRLRAARLDLLAAGLALLLTLPLIGTARADTETRSVGPFHAVSFSGSWTVDVTVGKEPGIVLEGEHDVLARVETTVSNGELKIGMKSGLLGMFNHTGRLVAHVTTPSLDRFARFGSGDATLTGLKDDNLTIEADGSGSVKGDGHVRTIEVTINGSGSADLGNVPSETAKVTVNGSGDIVVQPSQSLVATINGSGDILYVGEPPHVTKTIHGSGTIEKK